jgi:hypothetical protein
VRIGTWNLAGRWTSAHADRMIGQDCDVWLLTEVNERAVLPGYLQHTTAAIMASKRRWAAVLSRDGFVALADPHPASAAVAIGETTYCASVLPWRGCGSNPPWVGARHVDKTTAAVNDIDAALPAGRLVWGGDWNHALSGREWAGSAGGRAALTGLLERRELQVPTALLPHRIDGLLSIDHIALDRTTTVRTADRFEAVGLSDHDGYTVLIEFG